MQIHLLNTNNSILMQFVAELRDIHIQSDRARFRKNIERIGQIMAYEISKQLEWKTVEITTPLGTHQSKQLAEQPVLATILRAAYTVTADIEVPQGGAEGMMLTSGGRFAGYGFYLLKGKPVWLWNMVDLERLKWEGTEALTPGKHTVEFDFKYDGLGAGTLAFNNFSGVGRPGVGTLKVDGQVVATKTMPKTLPMILQWDESFDVGSDTLTGVNDADYQPPFAFTGKLNKLTVKLDRPQLSPEDIKKLEAAQRNNPVSE